MEQWFGHTNCCFCFYYFAHTFFISKFTGREGKEEKSDMSEAEKTKVEEGREKDKEEPVAKLAKARRGKCRILSEDKGKPVMPILATTSSTHL